LEFAKPPFRGHPVPLRFAAGGGFPPSAGAAARLLRAADLTAANIWLNLQISK
jgi:hypothetical protein